MVAGTGLALSMLRVRVASALHRAWTATMLAMLLLPVWTTWAPSITAPVLPAVREKVAIEVPPMAWIPAIVDVPHTVVAEPVRNIPPARRVDWEEILLGVYLAGVAAMLARLIVGTWQVRAMLRGAHQTDGFVTSPRCFAPVTIGWLRPIVLLPESWRTWPKARLDAVLFHEREHVRRRDPLVQWLALLNRCIFWFHPLAWWLERKLAALAEEACDAAVLAGGCAAHDYADYLIELARSVNAAGARIRWAGGAAFSAGSLPRRIRRILDAPPVAHLSRARSIALLCACTFMLAAFLACNVSPSPRTSSQPVPQRRRQRSDESLRKKILTLTREGTKDLVADVHAHPNNPDNMAELAAYYQSKHDLKALDELTLWFIGEHPDARMGWWYRPEWDTIWDKDGYDRASRLWTEQLKKSWQSPYVYMNAAEFLSGSDNEQAEQILLEGRRRFPATGVYSGLHWEVFLARHYAWALTGSAGQLPNREAFSDQQAAGPDQGAYAQKVRETLLASKDTELLLRTVEQLQINLPNRKLCRTLLERVLSIEPENDWAHVSRYHLRLNDIQLRAETNPGGLSDSDRMVLLASQLRRWPPDAGVDETKAHELVDLASRSNEDLNYGTAIFLGNIALGQVALNHGDNAGAARYLLSASEAPPSEFLKYQQIDMTLAGDLLAAGSGTPWRHFWTAARSSIGPMNLWRNGRSVSAKE